LESGALAVRPAPAVTPATRPNTQSAEK